MNSLGANERPAGSQGFRDLLEPLLTLPGFAFHGLPALSSPGDHGWIEAARIVDLGPKLADYARAAALIVQLDLVIAADTPLGHLAAGLGRPVWFVLEPEADWPWPHAHGNIPWYREARLFPGTGRETAHSPRELPQPLMDLAG